MKRVFLPTLLPLAVALSACSPQGYQVNPNPNASKASGSVPESQQEGYMRIIGDFRWDKLTTPSQWINLFPQCLSPERTKNITTNKIVENPNALYAPNSEGPGDRIYPPACKLTIGGITFYMDRVYLVESPTGASKTRTGAIWLTIQDAAQQRAFAAAIKEKYATTNSEDYCSKYTCFSGIDYGWIYIRQTPYATSILDAVRVDNSKF